MYTHTQMIVYLLPAYYPEFDTFNLFQKADHEGATHKSQWGKCIVLFIPIKKSISKLCFL